jgi:hypothetical protein
MSSGTVGTISNILSSALNVFSSSSASPSSRTFTSLGQTQTVNWSLTTNAVDYGNTSYTATFASVLDTADPDIPNNYPTHAITLNRIAYTQSISVSPTGGFTNTTHTYTIRGAPGTSGFYWDSANGYANRANFSLSGSVGDATAGSFVASGNYWITPGTYTVYVYWNATGHGDPSQGFSAGYATNTNVSVTVSYPAVTVTATPSTGMSGQIGTPFSGISTTALDGTPARISASGGSGGTYTYSITSGSQPSGVSFQPSGVWGGTPTISGFYSAGITATNGTTSGTISVSFVIIVRSEITSSSMSTNPAGGTTVYTVGSGPTISWTSNSGNTRIVGIRVNSFGQGSFASSGSRNLTTNVSGGGNFPAGSYSVFLTPVNLATNLVYTGTEVGYNYDLIAAPTASLGATATPGGNSSTAATVSVRGGTAAFYNWTTTGASSIDYYVSTNGSGFVGPTATSPTGPSGELILGDVTITSNQTLALYIRATNAAGNFAQSQTATITWTPYNEVLTISPTTFRGVNGTNLTISGCYPNESIGFSINNTSYADGTVTANSSGIFNQPTAFQGSIPGTYTIYIRMATTTHTRQATVTITA